MGEGRKEREGRGEGERERDGGGKENTFPFMEFREWGVQHQ